MTRSLLCIRAVMSLAMMIANNHQSAAGGFTHGCAARDMQVLMLIEEREDSNLLSPESADDAMLTLMQARMVCHDGRVQDAIALYDAIAHDVASETLMPGSEGLATR